MSRVLVISGHPNLSESNTNKIIVESLRSHIDNIEVRQLDELYPHYDIDVPREQQALIEADIVILQFPFYWYSVPALLKKWIDDVFCYDFAYGSRGDKLHGKDLILSFTIGGPKESYNPLGYNHFPIEQLLQPLQQTAYLSGMNFHAPIYSHGMVYIPGVYNELSVIEEKARLHGQRVIEAVNTLRKVDEAYVERFARRWFKTFDKLPEDTELFTAHLAEDLTWHMPEGQFSGHQGFELWYRIARSTFKPNCDHQIQAMSVTQTEQGFDAELTVQLSADTYPESQFEGQPIKLVVNERWKLTHSPEKGLLITDYVVTAV